MKTPLSWLKAYVEIDAEPHELARRLTLAGVEAFRLSLWEGIRARAFVFPLSLRERVGVRARMRACVTR
ncbi:MAG: hypothetical protein V3V35_02480 [Dehalococcoidia bacterium]